MELRGIPCIDEDNAPVPRRTLVSSRSFGSKIYELEALRQAVASFASRSAEKQVAATDYRLEGTGSSFLQTLM